MCNLVRLVGAAEANELASFAIDPSLTLGLGLKSSSNSQSGVSGPEQVKNRS